MAKSVGPLKITFVGASYLFVHKVARDFIKTGRFENTHLYIYDIVPEPAKLVTDLIQKMINQSGSSMKVTGTLNRRTALKDADFIILSISTGHPQAYINDIDICKKYGIWHIIGDTCGPAALSRNLRLVPVAIDLARAMERLCPKAVLLNFTNPMAVTTSVFNRYSSIRCIGMCHGTVGTTNWLADSLKVDRKSVKVELGGINHLSFITKVQVGGEDVTDRLYDVLKKTKARSIDLAHPDVEEGHAVQLELFRRFGALPNNSDRHACEFFPWFLRKEKRFGRVYLAETANVAQRVRRKERFRKILSKWAYGRGPVPDMERYSGEDAHNILTSVALNDNKAHIVNVQNDDFVPGLPDHANVEVTARVNRKTCTGRGVHLSEAILGFLRPIVAEYDLTLRAGLEGDRNLALQAMHLDPLVTDFDTMPALLDELLKANKEWLPQFHKKRRPTKRRR